MGIKKRILLLFMILSITPVPVMSNGLYFSNGSAPIPQESEITTSTRASCSSPVSNGTFLDVGTYVEDSADSSSTYSPSSSLSKGVFARIVIPLGKNKSSLVDCVRMHNLEIKRLQIEYEILKLKLSKMKEEIND